MTDMDASLLRICDTVTRVGVTSAELRGAAQEFGDVVSRMTRSPDVDSQYYAMDHRDPGIDVYFSWLRRVESAESAHDPCDR